MKYRGKRERGPPIKPKTQQAGKGREHRGEIMESGTIAHGAQQRPRSTSSSAQGSTDFSSRSKEPARPRSHTEQILSAKTEHSVRKQSAQEEISLPSVSATKVRRTTHSAFSQNTSLSSSEPFMQRKTSWTRPSTQIHRRTDITSLYD
nr:uncharacterized protein LOC131774483 [Pocillopora verrucosa]